MKTKKIVCYTLASLLVCGGLIAGLTGCASKGCEKCHKHGDLAAEAKISKADAEKTALAKVPNGAVKESELEKEHGKLIWSVDITIPDSKDIKEVAVNAITGEVVGDVETETPADQAKEAAEDAAKDKKKKGDKEDKD
jgi:Peptidase propeptide and YPEB domain